MLYRKAGMLHRGIDGIRAYSSHDEFIPAFRFY
jgi:hypothetical protein